jgi:hypothetical protein
MRQRPVVVGIASEGIGGVSELYCPSLARPLDWLHAKLFGRTELSLVNAVVAK